jgi:hypothetical protein
MSLARSGFDMSAGDNDLANFAPAFLSDDPVAQEDVYNAMVEMAAENTAMKFKTARRDRIGLSELKDIYDKQNKQAALQLLTGRHQLVIESDYLIPGDSKTLAWLGMNKGALDFIFCVPAKPGMAALLPNPPIGTSREWEVDFSRPQKQFKAKHAFLGFDPAKSMLYMGRCAEGEVWGAWAPAEMFYDDHYEPTQTGACSGDTRLSTDVYRWTLVFLAHVFSKLAISNVTLKSAHPRALNNLDDLKRVTNIR